MNVENVAININEIEILPVKPHNGLIGWASFCLNNSFYLGNIAIYSRLDGSIRLVFPQKTLPNGKTINIFHPINSVAGALVQEKIENKYNYINSKNHGG
jgi:DNA-binding cell septation regulator SpoVG